MRVDKTFINTINKQNVINIIRDQGPIFKAEISRVTGLSIPTIMKSTDEFIKKGLVREIGKSESSGRGKPPELLE
ncbi:MAG TPA: helix-turn-helix domain-containing protein, partial [Ruminiclostridium sp.]